MGDSLKALAERQEKVVAEIANYEKLRGQPRQAHPRPERRRPRRRRRRRSLKDQTGELAESSTAPPSSP